MFEISEQDARFLLESIRIRDVILVLGAGASRGSTNKYGKPVKLSSELAECVAVRAGEEYNGEPLAEVLTAVQGRILSENQLNEIYRSEFKGITPGDDISALFAFTWRKLYTWNIDDTIENITKARVQRIRLYNGMEDPVFDEDDPLVLPYIKLHGDINRLDRKLIMSEIEYSKVLSQGRHHWYRQLGQDYITYTPVFIGSSLAEPILKAEIERAKRDSSLGAGRSYLITPNKLSPIQNNALAAQGVIHINATLADFVAWLRAKIPNGITPKETISQTNGFETSVLTKSITQDDLVIAHALYPQKSTELSLSLARLSPADKERKAKAFLRGFPPDWTVAASDIPVWLKPTDALYDELRKSIHNRDRLFVVTGQAGSGKTTALMQSIARLLKEEPQIPVYELRGEVKSFVSAIHLLLKLHDDRVVLYVGDLFLYGSTFGDDIASIDAGKVTILSTARSGEWNEYLNWYLADIATTHEYSRFTESDYAPLIERLLKYVPAPSFTKKSPSERFERFKQSKNQLLIALHEATESGYFTDVITSEYQKLPDSDTKRLFLIVALGTLARVGIAIGDALEVYDSWKNDRSFDAALNALDGIVYKLPNGRLIARHELYVRHVVENVVGLPDVLDCQIRILRSFTKYKVPVVRNVNRVEGSLFRFLLNHDFILQQCRRRSKIHDGEGVYSEFEIDFQLDGHYWLQYGLYLAKSGKLDDSLAMLTRSIQAYPGNPFAVHALAELQLQTAMRRPQFDAQVAKMTGDAVQKLLELDARGAIDNDQYPMVTLTNNYLALLIKFGRADDARQLARQYFERLQVLEKKVNTSIVSSAKERAFKLATIGEWDSGPSDRPRQGRDRRRRR